ncbi:MAG: response regulator [Terricaulis sp.]
MYQPQPRAILVIDDEPLVAAATRLLLEDHGYTAVQATDWREAHALINANAFDLVISDVQTPPLDNGEIISRIRGANPSVPIVAMSANERVRDFAIARGANYFLTKPFRSTPLLRAVTGLLDSQD